MLFLITYFFPLFTFGHIGCSRADIITIIIIIITSPSQIPVAQRESAVSVATASTCCLIRFGCLDRQQSH